jgi:cytochrome c oxidase subunit 2
MKVIVETPEDYKKWLSDKTTLVQEVKLANTPKPAEDGVGADTTKTKDTMAMAKIAMK